MYGHRIPLEEPPCITCKEVSYEENEDALNIFFVVRNQLIMGFNGPIDINQLAIHEAIKLYEINNPRECFQKVLRLAQWWLNKNANR